jgi:hypothetical protein
VLALPYSATFAQVFVAPGSHAPPFDVPQDRIPGKRIVVHQGLRWRWRDRPGFLFARYWQTHQPFHAFMDGVVPALWTMNLSWGVDRRNDLLLWDNFGTLARTTEWLSALSDHVVPVGKANAACYHRFVLGMRKTHTAPSLTRRRRDQLLYPYDLDADAVSGLRDIVLTGMGMAVTRLPRPVVIIVQRPGVRRIINEDEVVNATRRLCQRCDVLTQNMEDLSVREQTEFAATASAIVGMHGSGLVHALWMQPGAAMVEILPYRYTCRQWYTRVAALAKARHFVVHTKSVAQSRWEDWHNPKKVRRCLRTAGECLRERCHDFLGDQSSLVDIPYFEDVVGEFFRSLSSAGTSPLG